MSLDQNDFKVVRDWALHLSRSAPSARYDLPLDKGRLFEHPLRLRRRSFGKVW